MGIVFAWSARPRGLLRPTWGMGHMLVLLPVTFQGVADPLLGLPDLPLLVAVHDFEDDDDDDPTEKGRPYEQQWLHSSASRRAR